MKKPDQKRTFILLFYSYLRFIDCINCRYEQYASPVQRVFDTAISSTLSTLRGLTLDERAKRLREQFRNKQVTIMLLSRVPDGFIASIDSFSIE